jgi:hypothetical protein
MKPTTTIGSLLAMPAIVHFILCFIAFHLTNIGLASLFKIRVEM